MAGSVDLSEAAGGLPLSVADVRELQGADMRALAKDPALLRVLLSRVRATAAARDADVSQARRDVARALEGRRMAASPLAAAVEALGRLSLDDQRQVFDVAVADTLEQLRHLASQAQTERVAAAAAQRRAELVLGQAAADTTLPDQVRQRLNEHLAHLRGAPNPPTVVPPQVAAAAEQEVARLRAGTPFAVPAAADDLDDLFS